MRQPWPQESATTIPQISILGPGQSNLPLSLTTATVPLYTAGRIRRNIDSANHQLNSRRAQELPRRSTSS